MSRKGGSVRYSGFYFATSHCVAFHWWASANKVGVAEFVIESRNQGPKFIGTVLVLGGKCCLLSTVWPSPAVAHCCLHSVWSIFKQVVVFAGDAVFNVGNFAADSN